MIIGVVTFLEYRWSEALGADVLRGTTVCDGGIWCHSMPGANRRLRPVAAGPSRIMSVVGAVLTHGRNLV